TCDAPLRLTVKDRLIDLHRNPLHRSNAALGSTAQVRRLPADKAPVPAVFGVQIEDLCGCVSCAEVAAETCIELDRGNKRLIAEHVTELERDAAADGCPESAGADRDGRLGNL